MHIKQVIISGFRSFRNQGEIESFSPKHNAIVGRNGSGKSNFFNAIQFVLVAPKFATLRQEDRQHLLHEGAGSSVMAAYVEIVFDNSDGRLSVDSDEVILRRTIGHKKDEFFLNRKRIQKSEVISLLESAGFSKSNPYYIVQQGKVANLCLMKDKDRLELLKEIAGTTVYEERRSESLKILLDTTNKQDRIIEVLSFIDERLGELEREKEELKEYDVLDKKRRALQFTLYDKELTKVTSQLETIETSRSEQIQSQQDLFSRLRELQDQLVTEEEGLTASALALDRLLARREDKANEVNQAMSLRSQLQVDLQEAHSVGTAKMAALEDCRAKLAEVQTLIAAREQELSSLEPSYTSRNADLHQLQQELNTAQSRVETLYGKQGRGRQFTSEEQRNNFLQSQIDALQEQISTKSTLLDRLSREAVDQEATLRQEIRRNATATQENKAQLETLESLTRSIKELITRRNQLQETRKTSWREMETFQEELQEAKAELQRGKQALSSSLPRHLSVGLATVERIAEEKGLNRPDSRGRIAYYGPLIDNFNLKNDGFRTAVEVAAGNALFHVVVDTDATAAMFMKELERRKAGRLTFLPLNQLRVQPVTYPDTTDVRSLLEVALDYDSAVEAAVKQVFSKKLLARDLDIAARYSRECQLDAITRDGDVVSRKGGFEGGYHDDRVSKIGSVMKIRAATRALRVLEEKEASLKAQCEDAEKTVSDVMRELQRQETERDHLKSNASQISKELSAQARQNETSLANIDKRKAGLTKMESEIAAAREQVREYQAEMQSELNVALTAAERAELRDLVERSQSLQEEIGQVESQVLALTTTREGLKADLRDNLLKRQTELESSLASLGEQSLLSSSSSAAAVPTSGSRKKGRGAATAPAVSSVQSAGVEEEALQVELDRADAVLRELEAELDVLDAKIAEKKTEVAHLTHLLDTHRKEEQRAQDDMAQAGKTQDKLLNKRSMLLETSQQKQKLIRELGSLPRKELDDYKGLGEKQLLASLKAVNEQLKEFSGVNRKALDQYISFNEQRQTLIDRKASLDEDKASIEELMENLDLQKEQTILNTFNGVSKHFSDVFSELVPGGQGKLVMLTAADIDPDGEDVEKDPNNSTATTKKGAEKGVKDNEGAAGVSSFLGVQVKVSFSETSQQFEMKQLSGGQKALVALAIIFAIQRCDPAPFYLFDEIDQALDANYRAGVARLIQKQVNSEEAPAQFITTTFRPELVAVASRCYGIALQNKTSRIYPLEKRDAQAFVTNLMTEEETIGATAVSEVSVFNKRDTLSTFPSPPVVGMSKSRLTGQIGGDRGSKRGSSLSTAGETYDDSYTYGGEDEGKGSSPEGPVSEEEYGSSDGEESKGSRRKSFLSENYSDDEDEERGSMTAAGSAKGGRRVSRGSASTTRSRGSAPAKRSR